MYDGSSLGWYLPISSRTRPSRFLRESTTTMRYCGTRTLPRRFKRILTATSGGVSLTVVCGEDPVNQVGNRVGFLDGHCGVRLRGTGRTGLSATFCQTSRHAGKSAVPRRHRRHRRGRLCRMSQTPPPAALRRAAAVRLPAAVRRSAPPYAAPPPRRKRPRKIWFVIGGVLLVLAPIIFVGALFTVLRPLTQEDAVFAASDTPVQVDLPAGEERALFSTEASPRSPAPPATAAGRTSSSAGSPASSPTTSGQAVARFDTGDGDVTFTATSVEPGDRGPDRPAALDGTASSPGSWSASWRRWCSDCSGSLMLIVTAVLCATGRPGVRTRPSARLPGPVGARLQLVAAAVLAPVARPVLRVVVVGPLALVGRADLQPPPDPVGGRLVGGQPDPGERTRPRRPRSAAGRRVAGPRRARRAARPAPRPAPGTGPTRRRG